MNELLKRLRKILNDGIKSGRSYQDILKDLNKLLDDWNIKGQKIEILNKMQKQYDWVTKKTESTAIRTDVNEILDTAGSQYALTKKGLRRDIISRIKPLLQNGADKADIRNEVEAIIGKARNTAETIARTAISGFNGADAAYKSDKAGIVRFTYQGPPAERPFCINLLALSQQGKSWTRKEIEAMDNGQGLDPFIYKGGYNCRHWWEPE